jgi:hypothetical protein
MKVLMFGWEFPPHISGGLGTACYGLTRGLSEFDDVDILFVVPKLYGDEDKDVANLIGAGSVSVKQFKHSLTESLIEDMHIKAGENKLKTAVRNIDLIEVQSKLQPYMSVVDFEKFLKDKKLEGSNIKIDKDGKLYYEKDGAL